MAKLDVFLLVIFVWQDFGANTCHAVIDVPDSVSVNTDNWYHSQNDVASAIAQKQTREYRRWKGDDSTPPFKLRRAGRHYNSIHPSSDLSNIVELDSHLESENNPTLSWLPGQSTDRPSTASLPARGDWGNEGEVVMGSSMDEELKAAFESPFGHSQGMPPMANGSLLDELRAVLDTAQEDNQELAVWSSREELWQLEDSLHPPHSFCAELDMGREPEGAANFGGTELENVSTACKPSKASLQSAFAIALQNSDRENLLSLLKHGVDPRGALIEGEVPWLHFAIEIGDVETVNDLLLAGADVTELYVLTPMTRALKRCEKSIIRLLLQFGAKVELDSGAGLSPYQMADRCPDASEIKDILIDATIKQLMPDSRKDSLTFPLDEIPELALLEPSTDLVSPTTSGPEVHIGPQLPGKTARTLVHSRRSEDFPRSKTERPSRESSLLRYAAWKHWAALSEALKDINIPGLSADCWKTLMDSAADAKEIDILQKLAVAPHNLRKSFGKSKQGLLRIAILAGNYELVEQAIRGGANLKRVDGGKRPLELAKQRKQEKIQSLLITHGA